MVSNRRTKKSVTHKDIDDLKKSLRELSHESNNEIAFMVGAAILKAAPDLAKELVEKYATVADKKRLEARGFVYALEDAHQRRLKFQPEAMLTERRKFRKGAVDTQVA